MRAYALAAALLLLPATGQAQLRTPGAGPARFTYYDANRSSAYRFNSPDLPGKGETCLKRKATGEVECHTFSEWREIARSLEQKAARSGG
jgi:hypothetical protein